MEPERLSAEDFLEKIETADRWMIEGPSLGIRDDIVLYAEHEGKSGIYLSPNILAMDTGSYRSFVAGLKRLLSTPEVIKGMREP